MAVLTAAIDGAIDAGTCGRALGADDDFRLVDVGQVEDGVVVVGRLVEDVGRSLTLRTAEDVTGRHAAGCVDAVDAAHRAAGHLDRGLAGAKEELALGADAVPEVAVDGLAVAHGEVVVETAGVVTLADGGQLAAAIDVDGHEAALHIYIGVAIDLTGREAVGFAVVLAVVFPSLQLLGIFIGTLTAAEDGLANQAAVDGHVGILEDVAVLTAAIDGAMDIGSGGTAAAVGADIDVGVDDVGNLGHLVYLTGLTAGSAEDVAAHLAAVDLHRAQAGSGLAGGVLVIFKGVGHTQQEAEHHILAAELACGALGLRTISDGSHRTQLTATEDVVVYLTVIYLYVSIAIDASCRLREFVLVVSVDASAAAIDVASVDEA